MGYKIRRAKNKDVIINLHKLTVIKFIYREIT